MRDPSTYKQLWLGKVDRQKILTTRPVRLYYDNVFGNWSPKTGDSAEGYDCPGFFKGRFGRTLALVSEDRARILTWLKWAKVVLHDPFKVLIR